MNRKQDKCGDGSAMKKGLSGGLKGKGVQYLIMDKQLSVVICCVKYIRFHILWHGVKKH